MTVSYWQDIHETKATKQVDVAIIGGGIMGAAAAYWLSKRHGLRVTVLESGSAASGASGRDAGFAVRTLFAYYNQAISIYGREAARELLHLNEQSLGYLSDVASEYGGDKFSFQKCGSYLLACTPEEVRDLEESAQLMSEDGFEHRFFAHDPLNRGYLGALLNPGDIGINTRQLVKLLLQASRCSLLEGEPVRRIEPMESGSIRVHSPRYNVDCERVLLLTNAYAALSYPWFQDKIQPVRGQILVTSPADKVILEQMCSANYGWDYFRQLPDRRFLLGGRRFLYRNEETGFDDTTTAPLQSALQAYLSEYFPEVAKLPIEYRWSGVMAFTSDELPIMGELVECAPAGAESAGSPKPIPGAYYLVGCNGHGLGPAMNLTKRLVDYALDGKSPGIFSCDRLQKNQAVQWSHAQAPSTSAPQV